jgi:hypothetical protein
MTNEPTGAMSRRSRAVLAGVLLAAVGAMTVAVLLRRPELPELPPQAPRPAPEIQRPPAVPPPPFGRTDPRQQILYMPPQGESLPFGEMLKLQRDLRQLQQAPVVK